MSDNYERSGPHRLVERWLDEMGVAYDSEHSFPPYKVDIYLPEWHLVVEVDGPHHSSRRDKIRDAFLVINCQLQVLRISSAWVKREVIWHIEYFISKNALTVASRKAAWQARAL